MSKTAVPGRAHRLDAESRKAILVEATLKCLEEYGFKGTSIRRISARAGVSVGLINHHFSGKEELVADAYLAITDRIDKKLRRAVDAAAPSATARLTAFFEASFSDELLDPALLDAWLAFWGGTKHSAAISSAHEQSSAAYRTMVASLLRQLGVERGWPDFDAGLAAIGLNALLDGLWLEYGLNPNTFSPGQGIRFCEAWVDGLEAGTFGYRS